MVGRFVEIGRRARRRRAVAVSGTGRRTGSLAEQLGELQLDGGPTLSGGLEDLEDLMQAPHERFAFDSQGRVVTSDVSPVVLAKLVAGVDLINPEIVVTVPDGRLGAGARLRLQRRLVAWTRDVVALALAPLRKESTRSLSPAARGLIYQLEQSLGTVCACDVSQQVQTLTQVDRSTLQALDLRIGRDVVFLPLLLRPDAVRMRVALCRAWLAPGVPLEGPAPEAVSFPFDANLRPAIYTAIGFPLFGSRAVRADIAEIAGDRYRRGAPARELAKRLGCPAREVPSIARFFS